MEKKQEYMCEGTCQVHISEEQYKNGLTACGNESCTRFGKPFTEVTTKDHENSHK